MRRIRQHPAGAIGRRRRANCARIFLDNARSVGYSGRKFPFVAVPPAGIVGKFTKFFAAFVVLAILAVAVAPPAILTPAQGDSGAAEPFDMVTDADGNGIADDFENAYNRIRALAEGPSGAAGDNQAAVQQAIVDFAARVPLHPRTRRLQDQINTYHGIMMQDITDRRRQVIADKIERIEQRIRDTDPVYVAMLEYFEKLNGGSRSAAE